MVCWFCVLCLNWFGLDNVAEMVFAPGSFWPVVGLLCLATGFFAPEKTWDFFPPEETIESSKGHLVQMPVKLEILIQFGLGGVFSGEAGLNSLLT